MPTQTKLDDFTRGYIAAALWSSTDDQDRPLDENYGIEDIAEETLAQMVADCEAFQRENSMMLPVYESAREHGEWTGEELAGHDFWLTRNGHGTGFWDRFYSSSKALLDIPRDDPEKRKQAILARIGDRLAKRCGWQTKYGEVDLYVGDDGKVYAA